MIQSLIRAFVFLHSDLTVLYSPSPAATLRSTALKGRVFRSVVTRFFVSPSPSLPGYSDDVASIETRQEKRLPQRTRISLATDHPSKYGKSWSR